MTYRLIAVMISLIFVFSACERMPINTDVVSLSVGAGEEKSVTILNHDSPDKLSVSATYLSQFPFLGLNTSPYDYVGIRREENRILVKGLRKTETNYFVRVTIIDRRLRSSRAGSFTVVVN